MQIWMPMQRIRLVHHSLRTCFQLDMDVIIKTVHSCCWWQEKNEIAALVAFICMLWNCKTAHKRMFSTRLKKQNRNLAEYTALRNSLKLKNLTATSLPSLNFHSVISLSSPFRSPSKCSCFSVSFPSANENVIFKRIKSADCCRST